MYRKIFIGITTLFSVAIGNGPTWAAQPLGCIIEPERVAEVGSPVTGIIESMHVERGDRVTKGQVIAVLRQAVEHAAMDVAQSRAQADAETRAAKANFEFAQQRRTRAEELRAKNFISAQALEQVVSEAKVAEQKLSQAQEQQRIFGKELTLARARIDERIIRSPFDGIVAERYVTAGERVEEKALVRVVKINPLRVEVVAPGNLFGQVSADMTGLVAPELSGAAPLQAKISIVDSMLDAPSNTFRVRLTLPNPTGAIPAGLRCTVEFQAKSGAAAKAHPAKLSRAPTTPTTKRLSKARKKSSMRYASATSARRLHNHHPADRVSGAASSHKL